VVSLPKKQCVAVPNNRINAATRLSSLRDRLDHKEALKEIHHAQMILYSEVEVAPLEDTTASDEESKERKDEMEDSVRRLIPRALPTL
jgi:hypothetical protein